MSDTRNASWVELKIEESTTVFLFALLLSSTIHAGKNRGRSCSIRRTATNDPVSRYNSWIVLSYLISNRWIWSTSSISCKSSARDGSARFCSPNIEAPRRRWCWRRYRRRTPVYRTSFGNFITGYTWRPTGTSSPPTTWPSRPLDSTFSVRNTLPLVRDSKTDLELKLNLGLVIIF